MRGRLIMHSYLFTQHSPAIVHWRGHGCRSTFQIFLTWSMCHFELLTPESCALWLENPNVINPFPDPGNRPYGRKWKIAPVCPGSPPLTIPVFPPVDWVTGRV
jgi:hypothetical protein